MIVLGLSMAHDAGVSILEDGRQIGVQLRERYTRRKRCALLTAEFMEDAAYLLLDQARILEGEPPSDTKAFTRRFSEVMVKALAA